MRLLELSIFEKKGENEGFLLRNKQVQIGHLGTKFRVTKCPCDEVSAIRMYVCISVRALLRNLQVTGDFYQILHVGSLYGIGVHLKF